ncbi:MAG TPA: S-adenosylmethionine:tRNA ribosyltransferase-isomerase [Streptosporangiaceae bacterium]|jgi:S-adenosylmethionine:tRNA ribosyltransferase-isomerase
MTVDFALPADLEAREPPEVRSGGRDDVALMVSRRSDGRISHHAFRDLPDLLLPGDLVVVNTSGTLPAAVAAGEGLVVHFSTARPDGGWLIELRAARGPATIPYGGGVAGQVIELPGGARLTLDGRRTSRLWRARLSVAVVPYLLRHGVPIRYSYVSQDWPAAAYQTVFATRPGSAEMPSASRPFTTEIVTRLVSRGVTLAPITLHAGVSSLEGDEDPYPEFFEVPPATARLVNLTRQAGGRVIAAGTTIVRALETAALGTGAERPGARQPGRDSGLLAPATGWTEHVVTPATGVRAVDGLLTGLHEPRSSHLWMLAAFAGEELLSRCYAAALERRYLWHEFGDTHLLLP